MAEVGVFGKHEQIRRRRYNTNTARLVGRWEQDGWSELLFRKKTGEYFIFGVGDSFPEGVIRPLMSNEAKSWIKKRGSEEIAEAGNEVMGAHVLMSLNVPVWIREALRNKAADEKNTISAIIVEAISAALKS